MRGRQFYDTIKYVKVFFSFSAFSGDELPYGVFFEFRVSDTQHATRRLPILRICD